MVEMQFGIVLSFFREIAIVSDVYKVTEFIAETRRSDRESPFTQVRFCFRYNKYNIV